MTMPSNRLQARLQALSKSRLSLAYDIFMVFVIVVSLLLSGTDSLLQSHVVQNISTTLGYPQLGHQYQVSGHPAVQWFEELLIGFLLLELGVRWIIAIAGKYYYRWFFFPFAHWYEVLAIFPVLRPLRLIRVLSIAYRLNQMGYAIIPKSWIKIGKFYYNMILEEISDRIVINVIDGIERELKEGEGQKQLIYNLIDRHRALLGFALADTLQKTVTPLLLNYQSEIGEHVRNAVQNTVWETTEVRGVIRQLPFVSGKIEKAIENMTGALAENLTRNLMAPLVAPPAGPHLANALFTRVAGEMSELPLTSDAVESLVKSVVFESLEAIRQQVATKQWQYRATADKKADTGAAAVPGGKPDESHA